MIYITNANDGSEVINLTRGDDAIISIPLHFDSNNEEYVMSENDYLVFSVREKPMEESELLIEIESARGSNTISIEHNDTADLPVGYYSAEVQLMTSEGKRITVWPTLTGNGRTNTSNRKNFCIMTEVVYR